MRQREILTDIAVGVTLTNNDNAPVLCAVATRLDLTVGFFSLGRKESNSQVVPTAELARLAAVGYAVFSEGQFVDVSGFYLPGLQAFSTDRAGLDAFFDRLVSDLSRSADESGGWALAGALHVAKDFQGARAELNPRFCDLADRALAFMASAGVPGSKIPPFLYERWAAVKASQ